MACTLLTNMDPPNTTTTSTSTSTSSSSSSSPADPPNDPACTLPPKEEELSAACLTVRLFHQVKDVPEGSEGVLSFPAGQYVAEELCISAAKACGEFPGGAKSTSTSSDGLLAALSSDVGLETMKPERWTVFTVADGSRSAAHAEISH